MIYLMIWKSIYRLEIREKYLALQEYMNERTCGIWAATEAQTIGRGGITIVSRATGLARTVIYSGLYEVEHPGKVPLPGFGRPGEAEKTQRRIIWIFPGDWKAWWNRWSGGTQNPPPWWACKSVRLLAEELSIVALLKNT